MPSGKKRKKSKNGDSQTQEAFEKEQAQEEVIFLDAPVRAIHIPIFYI